MNSTSDLFSMLSMSRNAFVVMDSDAFFRDNGVVDNKATFEDAKKAIVEERDLRAKDGFKYQFWFRENDADASTIESYLDAESLETKHSNKTEAARRRVKAWGAGKKLEEFNHSLDKEIEILYDCIKSWQA